MLTLRRGVVLAAGDPTGGMQELDVRLGGDRRRALADVGLVGPAHPGDEVVVTVTAPERRSGATGADFVHVNLTRGLRGTEPAAGGAVKLAHTSLQHAVSPVEDPPDLLDAAAAMTNRRPTGAPVAILFEQAQLAPLAWALHEAAPGARLGYVQVHGGALSGGATPLVRLLRGRGLLAGHITAGAAFGGEEEALSTAGALRHGFAVRHWHVAVCGPGAVPATTAAASPRPVTGRTGARSTATGAGGRPSGTAPPGRTGGVGGVRAELAGVDLAFAGLVPAARHGGAQALEAAHAAASLGCVVVLAAHPPDDGSAGALAPGPREALESALVGFTVATSARRAQPGFGRHEWRRGDADLDGYAASGLPLRIQGRSLSDEPAYFAAALAAGGVLAEALRAA